MSPLSCSMTIFSLKWAKIHKQGKLISSKTSNLTHFLALWTSNFYTWISNTVSFIAWSQSFEIHAFIGNQSIKKIENKDMKIADLLKIPQPSWPFFVNMVLYN